MQTQWEASKNYVGSKSHKWNVQIWRIYVINWRFIGESASHWLSYSCPMTLEEGKEKSATIMIGKTGSCIF